MKILLIAKLADSSISCILDPLIQSKNIEHVYVLRDTPGSFTSDKITYITHQSFNSKNKSRHFLKLKTALNICKQHGIDFIIGVLIYPHGYIGRLASIITGLPYIHVTIAGHREFWVLGKFMEKFNLLLFRKSHTITVTGMNTCKYLVKKGYTQQKIVILPNVIEMNKFKDEKGTRDYDIVSLSRLDKNKNVSLLLKAIAHLNKITPVKAIIAGDGPEYSNLVEEAKRLNIENNVHFPGWVDAQQKKDIYNRAKIFVLCSKGEGFPLSLLEAMACGCVPIVTDVGDISDAVTNGLNGYIIKEDNEKELASILGTLINDPVKIRVLSTRAKEVKTKFAFGNVVDIWDRILE